MDKHKFEQYMRVFLSENSKLNLISKNDEKYLWEKHVLDSLAFEKFLSKYEIENLKGKTLLDLGTGGGFPAIPIAINYPDLQVTAIDSIRKKINAVSEIKDSLGIDNLYPMWKRAEEIKYRKYDFITSRAVAELKKLIPYVVPLLKKEGYFIAYKSLKARKEISGAADVLRRYNVKVIDTIEYSLPLEENYTRNLIVISL